MQLTMVDETPTIKKVYLWVNICDIDGMGYIGSLGSPLMFLINQDLGDHLLPGAIHSSDRLDDTFVIIETNQERANAINDCLAIMGKHKIKRKVRTRITAALPNNKWRHIE